MRRLFIFLLIINYIANVAYFFARYEIEVPLWLYHLLSLSIGMSFIVMLSSVATIVLRYLLLIPFSRNRRKSVKKMAALGGSVFMVGYSSAAIYEGHLFPQVESVQLTIKNLKQPLKAVQLSDLHIGGLIGESYVRQLVESVNRLQADIIFLTGDMTDSPIHQIATSVALLGDMQSRLGIYYVLGNHEFFHGVSDALGAMQSAGIRSLLNDCAVVDGLINVVGVSDLFGAKLGMPPDLDKALEGVDSSLPTILLAHQPRFVKEFVAQQNAPIDLVLSGHTHGGQIAPFSILVRMQQGFLKGLYSVNERTQLYVNRGTGFWGPPMRLMSRAEITLLELKPS
ncbi:hypothetical protein CCZ01_03825 [Helicobacter monodelphidis]|nr:hypothetical protein CCZ01_03825 [Helicobacter sp. 15-1451]